MIHAMMARITGKEMASLYCVPFGGHFRIYIRFRKPTTTPTKIAFDLETESHHQFHAVIKPLREKSHSVELHLSGSGSLKLLFIAF